MASKYSSKKYPTAQQILDGFERPCSEIRDFDQNGLAGWSVFVEFLFTEAEDGYYEPDLKWMVRKPEAKRRVSIGTLMGGYKLVVLPEQARAPFLRYASTLEDTKMAAIDKIIVKQWKEDDEADC